MRAVSTLQLIICVDLTLHALYALVYMIGAILSQDLHLIIH